MFSALGVTAVFSAALLLGLGDTLGTKVTAAMLGVVGALLICWAEMAARRERTVRLFVAEGIEVYAHLSGIGGLVIVGKDNGENYRWEWWFQPETLPAIRAAVGTGRYDILDLLAQKLGDKPDPGAWLHSQGIRAKRRDRYIDRD